MPARYSERSVSRTIDAIYDAAAAPQLWMAALWQMRELFAVGSAALVMHSADRSRSEGLMAGIDPEDFQKQLSSTFRTTPVYSQRLRTAVSGQIDRVCDLIPRGEFIRSSMYQDYWRPNGMDDGVCLTISVDRFGFHHAINMLRPASRDPFGRDDIALADVLMPHLQRAVAIQRRIGHADMAASSALSMLDMLGHAVLLLGEDGHMLHANAMADTLLLAADGLSAKEGLLYAATAAATAGLHAVLAAAAARRGMPMRTVSLRLPKPSGGALLSLIAMPYRQEAHWSLSRPVAVLVCVTDPDASPAVSGRMMMDLFGLTGAEAALATDLIAGKDLRGIARDRGRSINTLRTQLARVMGKTGVNRQSELIRLLAGLPRARDAG